MAQIRQQQGIAHPSQDPRMRGVTPRKLDQINQDSRITRKDQYFCEG